VPRRELRQLKYKPIEQWDQEAEMAQRRRREEQGREALARRDRLREAHVFRSLQPFVEFLRDFEPAQERIVPATMHARNQRDQYGIALAADAKVHAAEVQLDQIASDALAAMGQDAIRQLQEWQSQNAEPSWRHRQSYNDRIADRIQLVSSILKRDIAARRAEIKAIEFLYDEPLQMLIVGIALSPLSFPRHIMDLYDSPDLPQIIRRRALVLAIDELPPFRLVNHTPPGRGGEEVRAGTFVGRAFVETPDSRLFEEARQLANEDIQMVVSDDNVQRRAESMAAAAARPAAEIDDDGFIGN
jgi:hypothetical protein